ncbi:MAG: type II toxin-antitoxin system RelE/ParE family toxin [Acidobacteria bacterium]|nr:type II toxin-antitoxin system RelE/ParE family toxin [Acidobacteriota bacterium]
MREIEWTGTAMEDMTAVDRGIARRVRQAVERFAETGAGDVRRLQGIHPPEYRLRVGDWRIRFHLAGETVQVLRVRNRREAYR